MKFKVLGQFLLVTTLFSATQAFALIDASVGLGQRRATFTKDATDSDVKGIDTVLSAHISPFPIPMVNIGLGVAVASTTWDKDDIAAVGGISGLSTTAAQGLDVSLEAMVALSIPFLATPYVKAGYSVMNTQAMSFELKDAAVGVPSKYILAQSGGGYTLGVGAKFSILPFISAMLEVSMYNGKLETDSLKADGVKTTLAGTDTDYTSTTYLLGVEVDIGM